MSNAGHIYMGIVRLYFDKFIDEDLVKKVERHHIIRLNGYGRFRTEYGWSEEAYEAIIDTGAHTSLVPQSIWNEIKYKEITEHEIQGLSTKPECRIPVIISELECIITDLDNNISPVMKIIAFLAKTDDVPLILGFMDLLSQFKVCFDYQKREAYIEDKD